MDFGGFHFLCLLRRDLRGRLRNHFGGWWNRRRWRLAELERIPSQRFQLLILRPRQQIQAQRRIDRHRVDRLLRLALHRGTELLARFRPRGRPRHRPPHRGCRIERSINGLILLRYATRLPGPIVVRIGEHVGIKKVSTDHDQQAKPRQLLRFRAEVHDSLPGSARTNVSRRSVTVSRFPVDFGVATIFEMIRKRCDLSSRLMSFARFAYWHS